MSTTHGDVKFLHFRDTFNGDTEPRGGVTVAFHAFDPAVSDILTFGVARCSKDDNFSKEHGRKLATERLNDGVVGVVVGLKSERQLAEMLEDYFYDMYGYTRKFSRKRRNK